MAAQGRSFTRNPLVILLSWVMIWILVAAGLVISGAIAKVMAYFFMYGWHWIKWL